jgi:hypothetical protein
LGPRFPDVSEIPTDFSAADALIKQIQRDNFVDRTPAVRVEATPVDNLADFTPFLGDTMIFLHMFSGRRREGDIQDQLEILFRESHIKLLVVSIDIVHSKTADLANPKQLKFWTDQIRSGRVVGAAGGPPCETWSTARFRAGGPPPLRSRDKPWGLPDLNHKHQKQVLVANTLLQVFITVFVEIVLVGACAFLEHPAVTDLHDQYEAPSIWYLEQITSILKINGVSKVSCNQGRHGAVSLKPTTFLLANISDSRESLDQNVSTTRQLITLEGKKDGSWNTAQAKEYPAPICKAIATSVLSHATRTAYLDFRTPSAPSTYERNIINGLVIPFDPYLPVEIGPDYATG